MSKTNNPHSASGCSPVSIENASPKALIERNRRRLERKELQKLEHCLVQHGKLSDVHLLDATINVLQAKSATDTAHMSASAVRLWRQANAQHRTPLQELDPNRGALFVHGTTLRKPTVRVDFHNKSNLQFEPAAQIKSRIWRPWEGEKSSTFFSFR
ncbi:hypothetical protein SprV_0401684900 [Sparganum proliferum]